MIEKHDIKYMKIALVLASKGAGLTSPNPMVGALVVKNGKIVGKGFHKKAGGPHAEVYAIKEAGEQARDADLYVSLEPCCHYGKTPPCSKLIIEHGLKRVFIASNDPNPLVSGKGIAELKKAGIEVISGILNAEAKKLNEIFFKYIVTGLPFITIKGASTIDGKIATKTGDSKWITGSKARNYVHKLRFLHDAILVGVNTILKDDPHLTCRLKNKTKTNRTRIIIDSTGKTPLTANIFSAPVSEKQEIGFDKEMQKSSHVIIFTTNKIDFDKKQAFMELGAEVVITDEKDGRVNLLSLFSALGKRGVTSVLVEGGSEINASIIGERLADKLILFIGPKIPGGNTAPTLVGGNGIEIMEKSYFLNLSDIKRFDQDVMLEYYFSKEKKGDK